MAVVEVDAVDAQVTKRLVARFADVRGFITDAEGTVWCRVAGEFGGEEYFIAFACSLEPPVRQIGWLTTMLQTPEGP